MKKLVAVENNSVQMINNYMEEKMMNSLDIKKPLERYDQFAEFKVTDTVEVKVRRICDGNQYTLEVIVKQTLDDGRVVVEYPDALRFESLEHDIVKKFKRAGLNLDGGTFHKVVECINKNYDYLPTLDKQTLGFNDKNERVTCFRAGCVVARNGKFYSNGTTATMTSMKGCLDLKLLKEVVQNPKRRLVVLHGLVAPFVAWDVMYGENISNPILLICGASSTGKTTIARFAQSLSTSLDYTKAVFGFNATDNFIAEQLVGNRGVSVLIDDTSLRESKKYKDLIYCLADVRSKGRLKVVRSAIKSGMADKHGTSVIMTGEENILYKVDATYKGVYARMFTLEVDNRRDLFETPNLVKRVEQHTKHNQGLLLPWIVKWMFEHWDQLDAMIDAEENSIKDKFKISSDILNRWVRYFAYLRIVATILKDITGIDVDADEVIQFMVKSIRRDIKDREPELVENIVKEELYCDLWVASKNHPTLGCRYITSKEFKRVLKTCDELEKESVASVIHILEKAGMLRRHNGEIYPNIGSAYGGRCYLLNEIEDADIVEELEEAA